MTTNILALNRIEDCAGEIDMDELYDKQKQRDMTELALFNKILSRIHIKIKTTSRQKTENTACWFIVPEFIIGASTFDQQGCIAYVVNKLHENGFRVKYFHPSTIYIAWNHFIPSYVRQEIKNKYGVVVNEVGEEIAQKTPQTAETELKYSQSTGTFRSEKTKKSYTPIGAYKPDSGMFDTNTNANIKLRRQRGGGI